MQTIARVWRPLLLLGGHRPLLQCRWLALLCMVAGLHPQTPTPLQSVRFTVFSARPITGVSYAPFAADALRTIVFYPTARSPRYEYRGPMPLKFVAQAPGNVVAEATIPPEIRDALLLFTPIEPTPKEGLRYRIAVLDDSALRHGPGGLAIINFGGLELSGTIGRDPVTLKSGLNPTLSVGRSTKIMLRTTFKGRSYQSYADTLEIGRNERALLILFPPFYKGSLEVQSRLLVDEPPATTTKGR